ncbi:hypothetical protein EDB83DRAFT_2551017 [Lactarius deliciosus]|nr:hypothetical protein EDB83DRAFT_2551017 [Lactarius deliciosus]
MNPFTPKKRCGKKAHKATRQTAVIVSLETVVGHVQRFVQDLGSAPTLSLPPAAWRSHFLHQAHESISADTTFGNAHFRKGEYRMAIAEYEAAIDILPTAVYLSNKSAAWPKLEAYDSAEECAQNALCLDPRFTRARYRRGLARKGNLQLAAAVVKPSRLRAGTLTQTS